MRMRTAPLFWAPFPSRPPQSTERGPCAAAGSHPLPAGCTVSAACVGRSPFQFSPPPFGTAAGVMAAGLSDSEAPLERALEAGRRSFLAAL